MTDAERIEKLKEAVDLLLECVDYKSGRCGSMDWVGAAVPEETLDLVRRLRNEAGH